MALQSKMVGIVLYHKKHSVLKLKATLCTLLLSMATSLLNRVKVIGHFKTKCTEFYDVEHIQYYWSWKQVILIGVCHIVIGLGMTCDNKSNKFRA